MGNRPQCRISRVHVILLLVPHALDKISLTFIFLLTPSQWIVDYLVETLAKLGQENTRQNGVGEITTVAPLLPILVQHMSAHTDQGMQEAQYKAKAGKLNKPPKQVSLLVEESHRISGQTTIFLLSMSTCEIRAMGHYGDYGNRLLIQELIHRA